MPISSLIVEVAGAEVAGVVAAINQLPYAEVSHTEKERLVVLTDTPNQDADHELWKQLEGVPGVAIVNLIYHNFEDLEDTAK